jgi:hypothetical protein
VPCIGHRLRFRPGAYDAAVVQEILGWVEAPAEPELVEHMADAGTVLGGGQFDLRELDAFRNSA